ncbi:unnamed protein product [Zymoseptoria tritici ST99CH_1E4]|uniref:Uncharacterized protein n=1 Tax=Zymoseptoria tritici ST99CH_1E4 TaxID=1276532 RepID=A0A2H1FKC0_ZYMTR|nr:unnamed protein product [Zymoseptoria tritici ST99CH_1E4]
MATLLAPARSAMSFNSLRLIARTSPSTLRRALSTLPNNPHIYVHEQPTTPKSYLLSYLSTTPPTPSLAIGTSTTNPPTPDTLTENPHFLPLIHEVLAQSAVHDPEVQSQAQLYMSQAGSSLGSGGVFFPQHQQQANQMNRKKRGRGTAAGGAGDRSGGDGAGGASAQGGAGGGGRGGFVHVGDQRNPPDFGRTNYPEDILGSLEIDGQGKFVDGHGRYQKSGTYRVITMQGMLGLSPYLRQKVVERLEAEERRIKNAAEVKT